MCQQEPPRMAVQTPPNRSPGGLALTEPRALIGAETTPQNINWTRPAAFGGHGVANHA